MSLSEGDRRRLGEIEREMEREDPEFVAAIRSGRPPTVRIVLYCLMFVAGGVVLIGGLVATHVYLITGGLIGVAGAVIMVIAVGRLDRRLRR
jgi:hypothetical protein